MYDTNLYLRKLAKSSKYQLLYTQAKETHIKVFENDTNLTDVQLRFISFLMFYSSLFSDYSMGEVDYIVFDNIIYEDAYNYYRIKCRDKKMKSTNNTVEKPTLDKATTVNEFQWVFKKPRKR